MEDRRNSDRWDEEDGRYGRDGGNGSDGRGFEESITSALLRKKGQQMGNEEEGSPRVEGGEVDGLKEALANVSATWKQRTKGQRLSADRWIKREVETDGRARWRRDLAEVLESTWTHVTIVVLLLVDLLATAIDILKTIHNKSHDLDGCVSLVEACNCVSHFERSKEWEWTYWTSIVILLILLLNVAGLLVAFGPAFFFHPGYVLDLFVVGTALALEVSLDADTAGLIIILTLWRIVRVAHGIFEVTDEAWEKDMHKLEAQVKLIQTAHEKDQEMLEQKDRRIAELEEQLQG